MDSLIFTNDYVIAAKQVKISDKRAIRELTKYKDEYKGERVFSIEELPSEKDHVIIPIQNNKTNSEESDFYFVFDREHILAGKITKKIFKAHRSSFSKGFKQDFLESFNKFYILLRDLVELNMYEVSYYRLDGTSYPIFSDRLLSLYELIVHSIEGSQREVLSIIHLDNPLEDVSSYMNNFFSSINEKLLDLLKKHFTVIDFDEFIELSLPDGIETYSKSLLFKEMVEDSDKESVKEALTKCLESL